MGADSNTIHLDDQLAECGCAGIHERVPLAYAAVAPQTTSEFNQLRLPVEPIACWRMDDARFDVDSSFIVPAARKEIALLRTIVHEHPGAPLTIYGHADPVGDDEFNKQLSGRRARVVYGMLIRDTAVWEDLYSRPLPGDQWDHGQISDMLGALPAGDGQPFARYGDRPADSIARFQSSNSLHPSGHADAATRAALFGAYMDFLCNGDGPSDRLQLTKTDFLARGRDAKGKGDFQGCGKFNPALVFSQQEDQEFSQPANHQRRNSENAPNRRVTIFLFEPGAIVNPAKWPCPRAADSTPACRTRLFSDGEKRRRPAETRRVFETTHDTFACRFYHRLAIQSPCEGSGKLATFRLRVCDFDKNPIPNAPCRILQGDSKLPGKADENGFLLVVARARPSQVRVEWTSPDREQDDFYPFEMDVFIAPGGGDDGGFQRLHNMGFVLEETLKDKVRAYQTFFGRPVTGKLADIERELTDWHDGGNKPSGTSPKA
jgi:outer membrane protein OmpA-like peptidoglycan-associated protein